MGIGLAYRLSRLIRYDVSQSDEALCPMWLPLHTTNPELLPHYIQRTSCNGDDVLSVKYTSAT